jgi:transposase
MTSSNTSAYDIDIIAMLKEMAEDDSSPLERQRTAELMNLFLGGSDLTQTAKRKQSSRNTLADFVQRFEADALERLENRLRARHPGLATKEYIEALEDLLKQPSPYSESYGWTIKVINQKMREITGIKLSDRTLRELLGMLGYRFIKVPEVVEAFKGEQKKALQDSNKFTEEDMERHATKRPRYTWTKVTKGRR